jgi:CRISPR-associated protein Csd1
MYEFENLQSVSNEGQINSSVLDRYFSLASTYPTVAFPKLIVLGQKHLRKLRRDRPAVAYRIDERMREIHNMLPPEKDGPYPAKLSLEDQGLFMLGYYHQKAWSVAQAIGRRQSNGSATNESDQEK